MPNWKLLANQSVRRVSVEGLEDRYALSATFNLSGFDAIVALPQLNADSSYTPYGTVEFSGPILDIPTGLAEGRTATVTFLDGVTAPIQLVNLGEGRSNLAIGRELPVAGNIVGEVQLTKSDNPSDRIVIGFQILVAYDGGETTARAIIQTVPTYSQQDNLQAPPAVPPPPPPPVTPPPVTPPPITPPVTAPPLTSGSVTPPPVVPPPPPPPLTVRPTASIGQSAFEAGAVRTAYEYESIRGVRAVVDLPSGGPIQNGSGRNELGYNFLRSTIVGSSEWSSDVRRTSCENSPVADRRSESRSARSISISIASWSVTHGTPLLEAEPAEFSPTVRELLERIAAEDAGAAIWMTQSEGMPDERVATDRRPYWFLAALLGLGAGQYLRGRDDRSNRGVAELI